MNNYVAIDIGGTNIKYGIVDGNGQIIYNAKTPTEAMAGGKHLCEKVCSLIEKLTADYEVKGIAISTAGVIDSDKGVVIYANGNLPDYIGTEWYKIIEERFHLPAYVLNDVHAAGEAEAWVGAGKSSKCFLCAAVGTGIGGSIFIDGKPFMGPHYRASALGYMNTSGDTPIYEQKASTSALVRNITAASGDKDVDGKNAFSRARQGNKAYITELDKWYDELAKGIANTIFCYDPELIIIGGAISNEGQPLLGSIRKSLLKFVPKEFLDTIILKTAECTNNAGMIGAVYGLLQSGKCS